MKTIREAAAALRARKVSCEELVNEALQAEEANRHLNSFITLTADRALTYARQLDRELTQGHDRGPLHGIPIAHKDLYHTAGVRTTNGSKLFSDLIPDSDAAVVEDSERSRRDLSRQTQHARTCLRDLLHEPALRTGSQST